MKCEKCKLKTLNYKVKWKSLKLAILKSYSRMTSLKTVLHSCITFLSCWKFFCSPSICPIFVCGVTVTQQYSNGNIYLNIEFWCGQSWCAGLYSIQIWLVTKWFTSCQQLSPPSDLTPLSPCHVAHIRRHVAWLQDTQYTSVSCFFVTW